MVNCIDEKCNGKMITHGVAHHIKCEECGWWKYLGDPYREKSKKQQKDEVL